MPLTNADPHYWPPVPDIVNHLAEKYKGQRVLEIGPGQARFPAATHFVDWQDVPGAPAEQVTKLDAGHDSLPFADPAGNWWDFVYCRHVLEDMVNPFHLIEQMTIVGKAGYIETPSPICELTRGVDGGSPLYRGYNHHRWVIWQHDGELRFITKFPLVEYQNFGDDAVREQMLRSGARYWNTYHLWDREIRFKHLQCPHDFLMPDNYGVVLATAMAQSKASTDAFYGTLKNVP